MQPAPTKEVSTCECTPHYRCTDFVTPRYTTDGTVDKCDQCKADARDAERLRAGVEKIRARRSMWLTAQQKMKEGTGCLYYTLELTELEKALELLGASESKGE
jgi:hypothetical protein